MSACGRRTSLFPGGKTGTYLLPVKEAVRAAENLDAGDVVRAQVQMAGVLP